MGIAEQRAELKAKDVMLAAEERFANQKASTKGATRTQKLTIRAARQKFRTVHQAGTVHPATVAGKITVPQ